MINLYFCDLLLVAGAMLLVEFMIVLVLVSFKTLLVASVDKLHILGNDEGPVCKLRSPEDYRYEQR